MPAAAAVVGAAAIGGLASYAAGESQAGAARDAARTSADAARYQTDVQRDIYEQIRQDYAPWREAGAGALDQLALGLGVEYAPGASGASGAPAVDREQFLIQPAQEAIYRELPEGLLPGPRREMTRPATEAIYDEEAYQAALDAARSAQVASRRSSPEFGNLLREFSRSDFEADPGYAFRQAEGMRAIERSAAARGGALSGGALRATQRFGQGLASEEYGNAFNRYQVGQSNRFNRLASLAGVGQTAIGAAGQAGSNYANAITGISQADAANQGNAILAAGNARASGYLGAGNAVGNSLALYPYLRR